MRLSLEHIGIIAIALVSGIILGAGMRSCTTPSQPAPEPVVLTETVTVHDTLRIEAKTRTIRTTDSIYVFCHDTVRDTIRLPFQTREYCDSLVTDTSRIRWTVRYTGHRARIDSFGLDYRFEAKPRIVEKRRGWGQFVGVGVGIGGGVSLIEQRVYAAPTIGLTLTYGWGYHW